MNNAGKENSKTVIHYVENMNCKQKFYLKFKMADVCIAYIHKYQILPKYKKKFKYLLRNRVNCIYIKFKFYFL